MKTAFAFALAMYESSIIKVKVYLHVTLPPLCQLKPPSDLNNGEGHIGAPNGLHTHSVCQNVVKKTKGVTFKNGDVDVACKRNLSDLPDKQE